MRFVRGPTGPHCTSHRGRDGHLLGTPCKRPPLRQLGWGHQVKGTESCSVMCSAAAGVNIASESMTDKGPTDASIHNLILYPLHTNHWTSARPVYTKCVASHLMLYDQVLFLRHCLVNALPAAAVRINMHPGCGSTCSQVVSTAMQLNRQRLTTRRTTSPMRFNLPGHQRV